jgi:hypothetical protein
MNTDARNERFVENLARVADKREQKDLTNVATMSDAEKIKYFEDLKREEEKKKLLLAQTSAFKTSSANPKKKTGMGRKGSGRLGRSQSHSHKLPGLSKLNKAPEEVEFTIEEGPLGVGVSQSKDTKYTMQFDYFTEAGNSKELSGDKLVPKMVLVNLNGEDCADKPYADLKLQLKEGTRPIFMKWMRSEENLKHGLAHVRGGGIEQLEEEWCDLEMTALKEAGAAPLRIKGAIQQERLRGTKNLGSGFRKLVWKDIFLEVRRDEVELWKTDARATSHGKMKLIEVKKVCDRVTLSPEEIAKREAASKADRPSPDQMFPLLITNPKLKMKVEWRPDKSPLHPVCFFENEHDVEATEPEQNAQRDALTQEMALVIINGTDVAGKTYDEVKEMFRGPKPLILMWHFPPPADRPSPEIMYPLLVTNDTLEMKVEWRPDKSPVNPLMFFETEHDPSTTEPAQNLERQNLNQEMALVSVNDKNTAGMTYDQVKELFKGAKPLNLNWHYPPPPPTTAGGLAEVRTEPGILIVGPKEPGSSEIVTWDLRCADADASDCWQYALKHNRAYARRQAGIRPQRRRSASWG